MGRLMSMTPADIELLYFNLNNSVLLGNSENAKMYLAMLREEYEINSTAFDALMEDGKWLHLRQLSQSVDEGLVIKNYNFKDDCEDVVETIEKDESQSKDQLSLVKLICSHLDLLRPLIGASENLHTYNIEQPTEYGKIDIVFQDNDTMYLVEVKKSDARYSVISQIDKYVLDYNLKLILKLWKKVIGVVIANGYIGRVSRELVKIGVVPIKYRLENGVLHMRRLHAKKDSSDS
jgi:RecB family endonuclease NucS